MRLLFLSCLFIVLYAYFFYPTLLWIISKFYQKEHHKARSYLPNVAIIIPFANESQERIKAKITNTMQLDYPKDDLEVVVTLDNPSAETERLVDSILPNDWKIIKSCVQKGKERMQESACRFVDIAKVYVFTDAATALEPNAIRLLVSHFADPTIGVVEGNKRVLVDGKVSSEGLYLRYENKIRDMEGMINTQIGAGGCLFAAREEIVDQLFLRPTQSDFTSALVARKIGLRTITDKEAIATFSDLKDPSKEFHRKYRTILRGLNTLWLYRELLNPFKYGLFSFQLWSHKLAKWLVPFALIGILISNIVIIKELDLYLFVLFSQIVFYLAAFLGTTSKRFSSIPTFFLVSNVAMLYAWIDFCRGKHMIMWRSSERT